MAINPVLLYREAGRSASIIAARYARRFALALSLLALPGIGDMSAGSVLVVTTVLAADLAGRWLWRPLVAEECGFSPRGADIAGVLIALLAVVSPIVVLRGSTMFAAQLEPAGRAPASAGVPIEYAALTWLAVLLAIPAGIVVARRARKWAIQEVRRLDLPGLPPPVAVAPDNDESALRL